MIPDKMRDDLHRCLGETALLHRTQAEGGLRFLELSYADDYLLSQLGITRDSLGPHLLACVWDEAATLPIGGYVVVDNLSMGKPSMGGIRMLPDIGPKDIHNLARGMTLKNGAADLPYGGGKSGIVSEPDLPPEQRQEVVRGFARLIRRYRDIYVPGPDVGTNDADMKLVAMENGIDSAVSKPADMGGNRIDELGGAAGGVIIALQTLLEIMPRLKVLPQFAALEIPPADQIEVLIQGFGAVGAHAARILKERLPEVRIVGISDRDGYLYDRSGLPADTLFAMWQEQGLVTKDYFTRNILPRSHTHPSKFSTHADNLLRESAFCLIPAASVFNYLDIAPSAEACMTVDCMGQWAVIVEGANTYSPDPNRKAMRVRMEQEVYRRKGVMIANDYMVNSGGVIFAAQEHLVPTPEHLRIPEAILGDHQAIEAWLREHQGEFAELSARRLEAGQAFRERVIRRNMIELVDLLAADPDLLPCKAAEQINLQRMRAKENQRTAEDIMEPIPAVTAKAGIQAAATRVIETQSNIIAVVSPDETLAGVITSWDITRAAAKGISGDDPVESIMTREVISARPDQPILDIVREMQQHAIWAVPVVDPQGRVIGKISIDLLSARLLLPVLQAQETS